MGERSSYSSTSGRPVSLLRQPLIAPPMMKGSLWKTRRAASAEFDVTLFCCPRLVLYSLQTCSESPKKLRLNARLTYNVVVSVPHELLLAFFQTDLCYKFIYHSSLNSYVSLYAYRKNKILYSCNNSADKPLSNNCLYTNRK